MPYRAIWAWPEVGSPAWQRRVPYAAPRPAALRGRLVLLNTDWPYGGAAYPSGYRGFEPLLGIHAACALHPVPAERLATREAVRAYTSAPALANFAGDRRGRLEEGFAADLAVLDRTSFPAP